MTDIARAELAKGVRTFGQLWEVVEKAGGHKFALRSALGKGRERGEFHFNGDVYSNKPFAKPQKKKAPVGKTGARGGEAAVATS